MGTLRMSFFGQLRIYRDGDCPIRFPTTKAQDLFCYLVLHRGRQQSRRVLIGRFWCDTPEEQARRCLRTELWRVRRSLETDQGGNGNNLAFDKDNVWFRTDSDYWLDVEEFENTLAAVAIPDHAGRSASLTSYTLVDRLNSTIDLYQGDLLEACYEDWCLYERERLRNLLLDALGMLMAFHRDHADFTAAIRHGERILKLDPLTEDVHRELMRLHLLAGNRAAAVRQYRQCKDLLLEELGIEPMSETTTLYNEICGNGEVGPRNEELASRRGLQLQARDMPTAESSGALTPLLSQMDDALAELWHARTDVGQMGERLEHGLRALLSVRRGLRDIE